MYERHFSAPTVRVRFFLIFLFFKFCIRNDAVTCTIKHFLCITFFLFFLFAVPFSRPCDHVSGAVSFDLNIEEKKKEVILWSERERLGI